MGQGGLEPTPAGTVRQCFGQGVRAGLYPLSPTRWYWFVAWNESPVSPLFPQGGVLTECCSEGQGSMCRCPPCSLASGSLSQETWLCCMQVHLTAGTLSLKLASAVSDMCLTKACVAKAARQPQDSDAGARCHRWQVHHTLGHHGPEALTV